MALVPATVDMDRAVRAFVAAGSGLDPANVIPGDDNHSRPNRPYATVKRIADVTNGIMQEVYRPGPDPQNQVNVETSGWMITTYSVQFYRAGARDLARRFRRHPHNPESRRLLAQAGLAWRTASDIVDISELISNKIEERVALTIEFRYTERDDPLTVNSIVAVPIRIRGTAEDDFDETTEIRPQ